MPKASELKRGMVIDINGVPHSVNKIEVKNPSSRGASTLYKIRFYNLTTNQKLDETLKGDDFFKEADCVKTSLQYSFIDGDTYTFMNMEDFSQYEITTEQLEGQTEYLTEGLEGITGLILDGALISIELPQSVALEIIETAPGIKGASASARTKPAILSTGVEVQVPEYLDVGTVIRVNTSNKQFMSRV